LGLELGHQDSLRVLEQLGAIDSTLALFVGLNNVLGIRPILQSAQPELKKRLLPQLAAGRELAAFALTEPGADSHPFGITSKAIPTTGGWTLQGKKIWSGSAAWAGVMNVFVKQHDAAGNPVGISGFVLQKGTPGLRPDALTMAPIPMVQNTVFLEQVPVKASQLLGAPGAGMAVAQDAMMYGRLAIAAASIGGMKRCAQLMLRYSSRRTLSTGRLLDSPVTLARLSWLTSAIATLSSLVTFIAQRLDRGLFVPDELYATCKILGPEFYWQAADDFGQCLGGQGHIETNLAPQILRDARVLRIFEGPTESLTMYLGARVLHQPTVLRDFLTELNLAALADSLFEAADEVFAYYQSAQSPFSDEITARHQANFIVGKVAAWGLAIAALKSVSVPSAQVASSNLEWAQHHFEQTVAQILTANPSEGASAVTVAEQIVYYQTSIGESEQTLARTDKTLDEWLQPASYAPSDLSTQPAENHLTQASSSTGRGLQNKSLLKRKNTIEQWLIQWLAQRLHIKQAQIEVNKALADYGMDSVMAVELAQDLEDFLTLSQSLDVTLAWSFPTVKALSHHLAGLSGPHLLDTQQRRSGESTQNVSTPEETDLADLSEAEMADMLAAELAAVRGR
ncbi:MAG: AMP-dependent synthetase, partial [Symploca sp. SIO2G7]|nr:AMP-dependent synthetase [Symploca sp. SIO2G7]